MEFMKKIFFQAHLPVIFLKEKAQFVAYTPALNLSTSGKTLKQAEKRFAEAAQIFLEESYRMGTLNQLLGELGWEKKKDVWEPPVIVGQNSRSISIPIPA
jgi:predicted RNase H-like HicB family nuclease